MDAAADRKAAVRKILEPVEIVARVSVDQEIAVPVVVGRAVAIAAPSDVVSQAEVRKGEALKDRAVLIPTDSWSTPCSLMQMATAS